MEKMMDYIMIGVDCSKPAEAALDVAIDAAKRYEARLLIISVHNSPSVPLLPGMPPYPQILTDFPTLSPKVPGDIAKEVGDLLKEYEERARKAGVKNVESKIVTIWDKVGAGLVIEAERRGVSLIIIGSRGLTGLKRTLLGSVADFVIKNAHCDVWVVRR
jgi:nucleotide-binding universal stress UspA family protein